MNKKYLVKLTDEERQALQTLVSQGKAAARKITRAWILLKADVGADTGWSDEQIHTTFKVGLATIYRVRQTFVEVGLEAVLTRRPKSRHRPRKLDGEQEAHLIALACSKPPLGRRRWTLRLLADKLVELGHTDRVCPETVRQTLKKNELKPWLVKMWCIPPKANAEFVWRMEDVLETYKLPYDPRFPQVCMDESSKQLVGEVRSPQEMQPGEERRIDYEYERKGTCNLYMFFEPLRGWRHLWVTDQRRKIEWADCIKKLLDFYYPEAIKIRLVCDNLNTHTGGALYEAFPPQEAKRLCDRLEFHPTPKHGSWLNMAETELSVLSGQCLDRRMESKQLVASEAEAWESERNRVEAKVRWRFTIEKARIKLEKLYPILEYPEKPKT